MARPDHSRQRLIATAARLLRRQGYAATGLKQVLAESGASSSSLYHHFPGGKEDLAVAAVQASAAAVTAELARLFDADDAGAAVTRWLDAHIAELRRDARDGCPIAPVALEAVAASSPLRAATAAAFETWITLLATCLERDGRPTASARLVVAAVEGALLLDRAAGSTDSLAALRDAVPLLLGTGGPGDRRGHDRMA